MALFIWQALDLLNTIGGSFSLLQLYSLGGAGVIKAAANGAGIDDCSVVEGVNRAWCSNVWVTIQVIAAFVYVLLHIWTLVAVGQRVASLYGGEDVPDAPAQAAEPMISS
eukprot:TRINITY_DN11811_c0_g1_i1.p2 TRINITY_DN11811_c0_g1~~TRINITY_DN11811_c0_g1_i1.p2  ORF type:complete len:110 (+),score=16.84 TRINITY_DN11811_c0_g1_i1:348-677(+)